MKRINRRTYMMLLLLFIFMISAMSCKDENDDGLTGNDPTTTKGADMDDYYNAVAFTKIDAPTVAYQAEDAKLSGRVGKQSSTGGYTGTGYVSGFEGDDDKCEFAINVTVDGFYDLNIVSFSQGGYKENYIYVDGDNQGAVSVNSTTFTDSICERVYLGIGDHSVEYRKSWGWVGLDSLIVSPSEALDADMFNVPKELVNPNADEHAKMLMSYLVDNYGKNMLTGQYSDNGYVGLEIQSIYRTTNKRPAVLGLDFMDYTPSRVERGSFTKSTDYAIEFYNKYNGIVTFCWHWNAPSKYITGTWYRAFYTESTNIDISLIMSGKDREGFDLLVSDIDAIAEQLKILQDDGVPVLWRPLHEASGGWFWWGAKGADAFKKLWYLLYDRLTNYHGLNNLIWVWNGQDGEWYPGDKYVDIIGEDIYPGEHVYTSQVGRFMKALGYTKAKKMIVLSENGCIPDPDLMIRDGAMWGFYATWAGDFVLKNKDFNVYSEKYTEEYMLKKIYDHPNMITLDELPDLKSYPY